MQVNLIVIQPLVALIAGVSDSYHPASTEYNRGHLPDRRRHHRTVAAPDALRVFPPLLHVRLDNIHRGVKGVSLRTLVWVRATAESANRAVNLRPLIAQD